MVLEKENPISFNNDIYGFNQVCKSDVCMFLGTYVGGILVLLLVLFAPLGDVFSLVL